MIIRGTAYRVAGVYAVASIAWILLSDRAVNLLAADAEGVARLQQWKGLFFVVATSVLIFWLVRRGLAGLARAHEQIAFSERYFRSLFENAPTGYQSLDEEGRILDVNEAWLQLLGWQHRDQVLGRHFADFLDPSQVELQVRRFRDFKACGTLEDAEFLMCRRDGETVVVTMDGRIQKDEHDRFERTHCVVHDITERKAAEQALRESERRLALALDGARLGTFAWHPADGSVRWSARQAELYGTTLEDFSGSRDDVFSRIHVEDRPTVEAELERARREKTLVEVEYRAVWPDGSEHWLSSAGRYQFDEAGEAVHLRGVTMDIDSRKRAEAERDHLEDQLRQAQKMEAVGQLAGGVAHDFNNLLQVVNGYCEMVLDDLPRGHSSRQYVEEVASAGGRAARLVGQLLAFSRRQVLEPVRLDLDEVVEDLLGMAQRTLGEHIRVDWRPGAGADAVVADRGQLEQVLMNLWINARDAMPDGGELVIETGTAILDEEDCRQRAGARPGDYLTLTIRDTGTGMAPALIERIWEPFFTTKPPGQGTGLGLSTVYGIVRQHDGAIHLKSEPGRGTTFTIFLPRAAVPDGDGGRGGEETVLVADGDDGSRDFVRTVLERAGYRVVAAADGETALGHLDRHGDEIDLALIGRSLATGTNGDLARRLRERRPGLRLVLVHGDGEVASVAGPATGDEVELLARPFDANSLLARVRRALGVASSPRDGE